MIRVAVLFTVLLALVPRIPCAAQQTTARVAASSGRDSVVVDSADGTKPHDSLFGLDKPKHFLMSAFVQSVGFSTFQAAGGSYTTDVVGAGALTAAFAFGKEFHDRRTSGLFSYGDLLWDAIGAATAGAMLRHTHR